MQIQYFFIDKMDFSTYTFIFNIQIILKFFSFKNNLKIFYNEQICCFYAKFV